MSAGRELAHFGTGGLVWIPSYNEIGPAAAARERRNNQEAIRAFETALLLEPGNREAKMSLAACFRHPTIRRMDEAREYYRQIIDEPVEDAWSTQARQALLDTFRFDDASGRLEWFEAAAGHSDNSAATAFYGQVAQKAREDVVIAEGNTPKAQELAESRLFAAMKKWDRDMSNGMYMVDFYNTGLGAFVESFGTNSAAAASRLGELLPRLSQNTPGLAPHILAGAVSFQVDTNAQVIAEFERSFAQISAHPDQVSRPAYYAALLSGPVYYWCREHGLYSLGAKLIEHRMKLAQKGKAEPLDEERKMALAFAYLADEHWQEALDVFQTWSNRPVFMGNSGLWGRAFTAVATAKQAAYCRQKLGLPVSKGPSEFELGKPCLPLHPAGAFTVDGNKLWVTIGGNLLGLEVSLQTNLDLRLPINPSTAINWLTATPSNVWIATAGAGLLSFDKTSHQFTRFTESDGLMMNFVTQAYPQEDVLWLGYGSDIGGGLGELDVRTGKFTSFTRSIFRSDAQADPRSSSVRGRGALPAHEFLEKLWLGPGGEVWFTERSRLRRYRHAEDAWEEFPDVGPCYALALTQERLFAGSYVFHGFEQNKTGLLGLAVRDLKDGTWRQVPALDGLPHQMVSAVTADGNSVWLGGMGFVALVDPVQKKVLKYTYHNAGAVDRIHLAGGYVWIQFGQHLYRARPN